MKNIIQLIILLAVMLPSIAFANGGWTKIGKLKYIEVTASGQVNVQMKDPNTNHVNPSKCTNPNVYILKAADDFKNAQRINALMTAVTTKQDIDIHTKGCTAPNNSGATFPAINIVRLR